MKSGLFADELASFAGLVHSSQQQPPPSKRLKTSPTYSKNDSYSNSPNTDAMNNFSTNAYPLTNKEKQVALSAFSAYIKSVISIPIEMNTIDSYPLKDPDNPDLDIISIVIPPKRAMTKEQIKAIDNKVSPPPIKAFKKMMLELSDKLSNISYDVYDADGILLACLRRDVIPIDVAARDWDIALRYHLLTSKGYSGGCPASLKHNLQSLDFSLSNSTALASAGLSKMNIVSVHADNQKSTNTSLKAHCINQEGKKSKYTYARWLDFNSMNHTDQAKLHEYVHLLSYLHQYYVKKATRFLNNHSISQDYQGTIMDQLNDFNKLKFGSALLNENTSKMSMHRDAKSPLPTLLAGSTNYVYNSTKKEFMKKQNGGDLFIADGLLPLSYGPRDIVLLNPNVFHGITNLQALPGRVNNCQMFRFSYIMSWRYNKKMNETWNDAFARKSF